MGWDWRNGLDLGLIGLLEKEGITWSAELLQTSNTTTVSFVCRVRYSGYLGGTLRSIFGHKIRGGCRAFAASDMGGNFCFALPVASWKLDGEKWEECIRVYSTCINNNKHHIHQSVNQPAAFLPRRLQYSTTASRRLPPPPVITPQRSRQYGQREPNPSRTHG